MVGKIMWERRLDEGKKPEQMVNTGEVETESDRKINNFTSDWKISPNVYIRPPNTTFQTMGLRIFFSSSKTDTLFKY